MSYCHIRFEENKPVFQIKHYINPGVKIRAVKISVAREFSSIPISRARVFYNRENEKLSLLIGEVLIRR